MQVSKPSTAAGSGMRVPVIVDWPVQEQEHGHTQKQLAHLGQAMFSEPMNRWLDEAEEQGPYNVIAGVVGWEEQPVGDKEGVSGGAGKKKGAHKSKSKHKKQ